MNYLLDTCAVSEFAKLQPDAGLLEWLRATPEAKLHLSALTLSEIQQGISRLGVSARRQRLQAWLDDDLQPRFASRVLAADAAVCVLWGDLRARGAQADFDAVPGLQVVNPWTP